MCGVEGDFEQLALGADGFQGGFARLFEFALEPWRDSLDQFFGESAASIKFVAMRNLSATFSIPSARSRLSVSTTESAVRSSGPALAIA